ncbi:MAG: hypothetical protein N2203_02855, partial [Bacteroidia bacterium]|nr:hypothetical protein [Bacteroidia bacterium]
MRFLWLPFIFLSVVIKGQYYTLPAQWMFQVIQDYSFFSADTNLSSSTYPRNPFIFKSFSNIDTNHRLFRYIKNDPALDIIFEKGVVSIHQKDFLIRIDPLINFQKGRQTTDTFISAYTNTRGFIASVQFDKVYIETLLSENQSVFPQYLYEYSKNMQVVPGQGRWKTFKKSGFDYAFSAGIVSVEINKHIHFTTGTGKQKIGNGYRSLFISDNAFVYPFIKIEQNWWKGRLQYICNYAVLNNLTSASIRIPPNTERLFQKKPFVYQYLNISIFKRTRMGFFQGIVGESADKKNVWKGDGILFSPVIFSQLLYYGWDNKNNVLAGMDFQHRFFKTWMIYGQFVFDSKEIKMNSQPAMGYQIGCKWLGKISDWRITLLSEWNDVTPSCYTSPVLDNFSNSSYSHFNQSLAFTPESGREWVTLM